ncbi:MAG: isoleucine--tRNA ligase [Candidatus Zixiibacteriota bacterium]|nr:MAG: isoleucine--tRNA ligase [candidate division Zixibacteria bacterium]
MSERYPQVKGDFNFAEKEAEISRFWEENSIFEKSMEIRKSSPRFIFYEGPPTANGLPHTGHALSRTIKDAVCRYKTMRGFLVERMAGWDTHGLPVELEVEGELGIKTKDEIEKFGIAEFNAKCRKSVFRYKSEWDTFTRKLGYWIDLANPYITCENEYIETVWWNLGQFWNRNLLYKGYKILPWCPRCQTALSSHEVAQGYEEVTDPSIFVTMKLAESDDTYFLVWTTTPWTLISNVALALNPNENYVTIKHGGRKLILAEKRLSVIEGEYEVLESKSGSDYYGVKYEPLFDFLPVDKGHYALNADFVSMDEGTGIVHIAPAFGADDYDVSLKEGISVVQGVDIKGDLVPGVTKWAGRFVKDADPEIIEDLKARGLLYNSAGYTHNYPFCWRCNSPLLYYARSSWFIKTTEFKDEMIKANKEIKWYPEEVGQGRLGEWLENNVDWALSRERYWGTPLPVWICENCGKQHCIGSIEELKKMALEMPEDLDLHRPFVDKIFLKCPECGGKMKRTSEVIDAWFDSGSMPYGQVHYPFENKDEFEEKYFPAAFIAEGLDQTRGWFYTLLAISVFISGRSCYQSCVVNNLVLDGEGRKMSKSLGNYVNPLEVINEYGADALRWYLIGSSQVWLPKRFDKDAPVEVLRRFFSTFQNTYSFFALYANIDNFEPDMNLGYENRPLIDRWVLSRLNSVIEATIAEYENNDLTKVSRYIGDFVVDNLSNWYVRRSRRRFWGSQESEDKKSAYQTLYECLLTSCKLIAPLAPFISDDIYRRLIGSREDNPESVHLCGFPVVSEKLIDKTVEEEMDLARRVVELGRAGRKESQTRTRQPLKRLIVLGLKKKEQEMLRNMEDIVLEEINVKSLEFDHKESSYFSYRAEPDFKKIGPRFGGKAKAIAEAIKALPSEKVAELSAAGTMRVELDSSGVNVKSEDVKVRIDSREGFSVMADGYIKVALDLHLDDDLLAEGNARELVNKVQNLRKSAGLMVTDRVVLGISENAESKRALSRFSDYIKSETLADNLSDNTDLRNSTEFNLNGVKTIVALEKIK